MTSINFAALAAQATEMTVPEKFSEGIKVLLLGMVTVFVVLAVLWFVLYLFKVIFYREKSTETKKAPAAPAPEKTTAPAPAPAAAPADDGALIAAITAAIAAYTADDASFASGFRVVSFRRSEHASPWTRNGK